MKQALAPHRPWFLAGALLWAAATGGWALVLAGRFVPPLPVPVTLWHALPLVLGVMPAFILGFALQALPRWLGLDAAHTRGRGRADALCALGWLTGWGLLLAGHPTPGLGLAAALLLPPWLRLARLWRRPERRASPQALVLLLALAALVPLLVALAATLGGGGAALPRALLHLGLWLCIAPVFGVALQRLTPFMLGGLWRVESGPALRLLWALLIAFALLAVLDPALPWHPPAALRAVAVAVWLALALRLWRGARRPELAAALRQPLVAQLGRALDWLCLGLGLAAAACLWALAGHDAMPWRDAALHALTLGFMAGAWLAMVSRVTATQAGRAQAADRVQRALYGLLQAVVVARVAGALLPGWWPWLWAGAAAGFALLALAWLARHGPWLLRRGR